MAVKLILVLSLVLTVALVNGQSCFPSANITNLWGIDAITTQAAPVAVTSKVCGDSGQSCCDDATLDALKNYWDSWRGGLGQEIAAARVALKGINIDKQFEEQSNISLNALPDFIRKPFQNALSSLQNFYNNYGNHVQSCYEGALQYYAGALCTFCSPSWNNTLTVEEVFPNYYAANWNVSNATCSYIANKCAGLSDATFDLFGVFSDVAKSLNETSFFDNKCPRGFTDTSAEDDTVLCAPDCRYVTGFVTPDIVPTSLNFSELLDAGFAGRQVVATATTRDKTRALFAFLDEKVQTITRTMQTIHSSLSKRQTQAAGQFAFSSSTISTGSYNWVEVNHYGQGGSDISSRSTSLSTQGSGGSSSAMTSLPYVTILAFVVALFMF